MFKSLSYLFVVLFFSLSVFLDGVLADEKPIQRKLAGFSVEGSRVAVEELEKNSS